MEEIYPMDLASDQDLDGLIRNLSEHKFYAIVNNAAEIDFFEANGRTDKDKEIWQRALAVNLTAPMKLSVDLNIEEGGSIVNISSTDAEFAGYSATSYSVSKAGLNNLTKSLAGLLSNKKIRVNAIAPGWVDTHMAQEGLNSDSHFKTPLGRNATPNEIANVVEFLISEKASFINGSIIKVDGGYSSTDYVLKKEDELTKNEN